MNTKLLMILSAAFLGAAGIMLSFLPQEVASYLNIPGTASVAFQVMGALYVGFGMLNWTAKGNIMGGIYSRPVAIGNFTHFCIGGIALLKWLFHNTGYSYIWGIAMIYALFAVFFGYVLFTNPVSKSEAV